MGGGGASPDDGLYGKAPPERGTFFKLQVYERVGILLVEVYERVGESIIWVCERASRACETEECSKWINVYLRFKNSQTPGTKCTLPPFETLFHSTLAYTVM